MSQEPNLIGGLDALAEACSLQDPIPIEESKLKQIGGAIRLLLQRKESVEESVEETEESVEEALVQAGEQKDESKSHTRNKILERTVVIGGILGTIFSMLNTEFNKIMSSNPQSKLIFDKPDFNHKLNQEEQEGFCATFGEFFTESVSSVITPRDKFLEVAVLESLNTITIGNEVITIHNDGTTESPILRVMLSIAAGVERDITERLKLIPGQPQLNGYKVTAWCAARISTIHFELLKWGDLVGSKEQILDILQNPLPTSASEERMNTAFEYALYGYEEAAKLQSYTETQITGMSNTVSGTLNYVRSIPDRITGSIPSQDQVELYIARKLPVLWPVLILTKDYPLHALVLTLLMGYLLRNEIRSVCGLISRFSTFIKNGIRSAGQRVRLLERNGGTVYSSVNQMVRNADKGLTGKIAKLVDRGVGIITGRNKKFIQPPNFILNHLSFLLESIKINTTELVDSLDKKGGKRKHKKTQRNKRNNRRRTYKKTRR
jgi:hypothetical protein